MGKIILEFKRWFGEYTASVLGKELVNISPVASQAMNQQTKINLVASAVDLVRQYDLTGDHTWMKNHLKYEQNKKFGYLLEVDTIAPLGGNAFGMFVSNEIERILPPGVAMPYQFQANKDKKGENEKLNNFLKTSAIEDIKKQFPNFDTSHLMNAATIHLNIPKTKNFVQQEIAEKRIPPEDFDKEMIIRLGSTIVHESVHALERKYLGETNEVMTEKAEKHFTDWANVNSQKVLAALK